MASTKKPRAKTTRAKKTSAGKSAPRARAKAREARLEYDAITIEGGLLSPEWLSKVGQLAAGAQEPADYAIPKGLNLRDEIGRYWRIAQAHWSDLVSTGDGHAEPQLVAERFVTQVLRDCFGFASLSAMEPRVVAERLYPVGHAALGGRVPVVIASVGRGLDVLSAQFGDGTRRRSAFGLAQELLNADESSLWGLASDGHTLRILRDNASLTRPAWVEADLQRIFTEERYADFAALWLLMHESRFGRPDQPVTECALEAWRNAGREEGTRAREHLRGGVEEALLSLGQGFVSHPDNVALRAALADGSLTLREYMNQLLRLVYRFIFVITVEERGVLHPEGAPESARELYAAGYAFRRLRDRAVKRSAHDRFSDLWESAKIVFRGLAASEPRLGLPALAGIFSPSQCPALDEAKLENRALLHAVFKLAWLRDAGTLVRVNWRDMGPEELGSVYESLLELVPQLSNEGREFGFAGADESKGNARKTSGSYYTPDSLVQVLLDSALEPVVSDSIARNPGREVEALLGLSIVDPACGSGHFLLAAARRLAAHVARLEANGTPSAAEYRHALRQVVGRCIYGVDLNPMAVELCKVSLWMEAVEPGLPLTFLDSHIQCGNSLLGTTPELMAKGVPDAAWDPIEGDDKKTASALKKRNKKAAEGQRSLATLWTKPADTEAQAVTRAVTELDAASDANVEALAKKEERWDGILGSPEYRHQKFVADAWCSAFVWPKQPGDLTDAAPTNELWRQLRDGQGKAPALTTKAVEELAGQYRFFHWPLQFPQVLAKGGFDVVLGNPPWEKVKLLELEFFASRSDAIAKAPNASARKKLIAALLQNDPQLWAEWTAASRRAEGESHLIHQSGRFPLCGKGDVNTYAVFAEHNRSVLGERARAGFIVPTGIATDDTTKEYFAALVVERQLAQFYSFENEEFVFPGVHHAFRFALLTIARGEGEVVADLVFFARQVSALDDSSRHFFFLPADFETVNPNTRTCPTFRSKRDAEINLRMYRRAGILWREADDGAGNPWNLQFLRMFDMTNDAALFKSRAEVEGAGGRLEGNRIIGSTDHLPLIEAKMVHHFDHRFGTFEDQTEAQQNQGKLPEFTEADHANPHRLTLPGYWVSLLEISSRLSGRWDRDWLLCWRDITNAQNQRTVVASLIPPAAVGNTSPLMMPSVEAPLVACLYASLCSFPLDYAARQKVGGTHLNYLQIKQLPALPPRTYQSDAPWEKGVSLQNWLLLRVLELTFTAWDVEPFARDLGYEGTPFRWDTERRFKLRCELDAAFFHLYGMSPDDVAYVMDAFPIVRKNDEKAHGEYRTKHVILEIYDGMAEAAHTCKPYRTPLDPTPASRGASHGWFDPKSTPKDYAEALRMGLLFTLIRRAGDAGISRAALSRALVWLEDAKHAASGLSGAALADFERIRESDSLLAQGTSDVSQLLQALENEKVITRDAKGVVRLRAGSTIPKWLPQTPTLAKLASVMRAGLEQAEAGASTSTAVDKVPTGKAKRA